MKAKKRLTAAHAEERFRLSFEEAPVGMALLNGDGIWLRVNRSLCEMTGYSERELIALNHGITHPDDMPETQRLVKSMKFGEISSFRQEKRYKHKNGTVLNVLVHVSAHSKDSAGKARGFIAHMVDITKLKLAEAALRASAERFRVALKTSPIVVFNQDYELRYTWINSPVLAWALQDYVGHTDAEIVGGEEGARLMAIKQGVLMSGIGTRTETSVTFQGETHYYDLTVEPLRDDKQAIVGITCAAVDVTPMKQATAELERLNQLKTEFLGMAAHDLRNPIGSIISVTEFLCDDLATVLTEEKLGFLSAIRSSSEFMLQLIDDFLDLSLIELGNLRSNRRPSDPRKLLERIVGLNAIQAQKKHIHVGLQIEGALPKLSLDEGKIEQVLNNLMSNAIKFSRPGTAVEVRAAAQDAGVLISVRDQGPGVSEAERLKLFQPFGRTSVRATAGKRGSGLGLAISRKIVEGHGGRIWVESHVGLGSVFHFTLPA